MTMPDIRTLTAKAEQGQPEAQFLLSQVCLQNQDVDGMIHWLRRAVDSGLPIAFEALGSCYEKGRGIDKDMESALGLYEEAIHKGLASAGYRKAELLYKSTRAESCVAEIEQLLKTAVDNDVPHALRTAGYLAMQHESMQDTAASCLQRVAQAGDPIAREMLTQVRAEMTSPYRPVPIPEELPLFPGPRNDSPVLRNEAPRVMVIGHVLDDIDCSYLMHLARPYLARAGVINPEGEGPAGMISNVRTNLSTYLPFSIVDFIGRYIELKIIGATGEDLEHSEPMSVLCYSVGEQYEPHFDYFNPDLKVSGQLLEDGGQRRASAVTYLSEPESGGGTSFPKLGVAVPPERGATLYFENCNEDGEPDPRSLHAGDPVRAGQKWVVTKWFRERPTSYLEC
jgi:prolyl 4-hydroxylase